MARLQNCKKMSRTQVWDTTLLLHVVMGSRGFIHLTGKMAPEAAKRVPFAPEGVRNPLTPSQRTTMYHGNRLQEGKETLLS